MCHSLACLLPLKVLAALADALDVDLNLSEHMTTHMMHVTQITQMVID